LAASAAVALATGAAACGSSPGSGGSEGPAAAVPAGAPVYVEAALGGQGARSADARALLRRVLRTADPRAALLHRAGAGRRLVFRRDVQPWLGQKAGAALTSAVGQAAQRGLVVVESRDDGKAAAKLDALLGGRTSTSAYRGVQIRTAPRRADAAAVLDGHVLMGTPAQVRAGLDVLKGVRQSLGASSRFTRAREAAGADGLAFLYADVRSVFRAQAAQAGPVAALLRPVADTLPEAVGATLRAERHAFVVDGVSLGGRAVSRTASSGAAAAVAGAPGGSWLAAGVGDVGRSLESAVDAIGASGLGGVAVAQIEDRLRRATGLELRRDVLSWMDDAALFIEGDRPRALGGALVVRSSDPAKTAIAVRRLGPLLRATAQVSVRPLAVRGFTAGWSVRSGRGRPVLVAAAGGRFVVAFGRRALVDAVATRGRLRDVPSFRAAAAKLGGGYATSFWLNVPVLRRLAQRCAREDGRAAQVAQALRAFGASTAGVRRDGDVTRMRLRVPVR